MKIISTELGADSMVLRVAGHDGDAYETWYTAHALARQAVRDDGAVIELERDGGTQAGLTND